LKIENHWLIIFEKTFERENTRLRWAPWSIPSSFKEDNKPTVYNGRSGNTNSFSEASITPIQEKDKDIRRKENYRP
jgi:hypothetical protein